MTLAKARLLAKVRPALAFGLLLLVPAWLVTAADPAFVGKLALIADPEVAKELDLTDDVKKKLMDLIDKREQEAIGVVAKLKGQPAAKQAEALAPFVAESEKMGKALLDDTQLAKLDKFKVAKDGMVGILAPDMVAKLQITDDQKKEIAPLIKEYNDTMATGSEFKKRFARQSYEKKIAGVLNDAQRGQWESLSGTPAGGSAVAQASTPAAPPGPGGSAPPGPGGVNVQRAGGVAELDASEDGMYKLNFVLTPWKNVIEYFAKKGGYAFTTEKWPNGTFTYTDPKSYTAEQVIDVFNLHLMSKGFILIKKEKLLRLWDTANDGPVPPEYVPEITPDEIQNHGEYSVLTVYFQLDKWPPSEAEAEIKKRLGPYGSITVLNYARQLVVTELGGRLRWIKRTIDEVEKPQGGIKSDDRLVLIKLNRLTPTEFMTNVRQLMGIPDNQWATTDGNLRLSTNELDGIIICSGKLPQIERVQELAKQLDGYAPAKGSNGSITIAEQDQFAVYPIMYADPVYTENVIRTLLASRSSPSTKIQLDPKTQKLAVWGPQKDHQAVQAIIFNLEQNGDVTEVIRLKKLNPQDAMTGINQVVNRDPSGKGNGSGLSVSVDALTSLLTLRGTPAKVEEAKSWLSQMGEPLGGFAGPGGRQPGMPDERAAVRVLPLSTRTMKQVLEDIPNYWGEGRPKVRIQEIHADAPPAAAKEPEAATPPAAAKKAEPKGTAPAAPKTDARPWPQPNQPAIRPDKPARPAARKSDLTTDNEPAYFVSVPSDSAPETPAEQPAKPAEEAAANPSQENRSSTTPPSPAPQVPPPAADEPAEIIVRVTPKGIVIQSQNLDALDEFESMLQELVAADDRKGKRTEVFPLKFKDADIAANMLKAMIDGGANVADSGLGGLANMIGGPLGGVMSMFGSSGGGSQQAGGSVSGTTSGTPANITPDMTLNVLYVTGLPRDLDNIEALIKLIDKEESPEPPVAPRPRFIPVMNLKADVVASLVREQFAGQIYGDSSNNRQQMQIQPQDVLAAMMGGGRGGRGGPGGGGGGRNQQQNLGEKKKIMVSVASETNSLIVTAPDHLFEDVENFVKMVDLENVIPDAVVRMVKLRQVNPDAMYTSLVPAVGTGGTVSRVLPYNSAALAGRGGQTGNVMNNQPQQPGARQGQQGNQLNPALAAQMQQFNQGQRGNRGQGGFGQPGGFGQGGFGQPGGFGGGNRGGGQPGGGGRGGFGGGGQPGGNRGGGGAPGGNRGGGGAPGGGNVGGGNRGGGAPGGGGGNRGGFQ
jgi:type II secretory pathway component GspD/PulD (secretin)